jgi:hypothetical protein
MSGVKDFIAGLNERTIVAIGIEKDLLAIEFNDGSLIEAYDYGQQCCEWRHMTCDDDLPYFIGSTLLDIELRDGGCGSGEYEYEEIQFMLVTTTLGVFTVCNHNEHNGYYGGFELRVNYRGIKAQNVYHSVTILEGFEYYE